MISKQELQDFLNSTQEVGRNFFLTQGAGGNTSYKSGDSLFIKASGLKLKDAKRKNIFVEVNYRKIINNLNIGIEFPIKDCWDESKANKPSMETTMHSIMPHKFVFHLHCLNTISLVVQKEFKKKLDLEFKDLNYSIINYAMPGTALTKEIQREIAISKPDVLFLSNHGLVVGSNSVNDALKMIYIISKKLNANPSKKIDLDLNYLKEIAFESCYRPTKFEEANQLAASEYSRKLCSKGALFPDQVVFLGPKIYNVNNKKEFKSVLEEFKLKDKLPIIIVKKAGVLVPYDISHESEELLLALSIIISKIPVGKKLNYLNKSQVDELTKSDAEKYRLKLNT